MAPPWTPRCSRLTLRPRRRPAAPAVACLLAALGLGSLAGSAGAAEPGLALPGPDTTHSPRLASLGTHWVRMFLTWPDVEPSRGSYSAYWLGAYESSFRALPAGTKVLLDVVGTPRWETGSSDERTPPANRQDYAAMLAGLAARFGGQVRAYEVWNEEDAGRWWIGAPDPVAYTALLKAAYNAVKGAEPRAEVLPGGFTGNDYPFLEGLYAAGAKGYFDAVAVHTDTACNILSPYSFLRGADNRILPDSFLGYREVHAVMLAHGDDKPIWMTEMSWRTSTATCSEGAWAGQKAAGVSEQQQARFLSQAYHCLEEAPYVKVGLWFPLSDEGLVTSGLLREDGSPKPAYGAMKSYAHEGDRLTEPCGVFTGPRISIASPSDNLNYSGPLPIRVSASSAIGVFRIRLEIDGKLIRNYDGASYPSSLAGAITWQGAKHISPGRHTLSFLAYDKERNVSRASITIFHGATGHRSGRPGGSGGANGGGVVNGSGANGKAGSPKQRTGRSRHAGPRARRHPRRARGHP